MANSKRLIPFTFGTGLALCLMGCLTGCLMGPRFTATSSRTFSASPAAASIDAVTDTGAITLGVATGGTATAINAKFTCGGTTQADADQRITQIDLDVETLDDNTVRIRPIFPKPHRNGDRVSLVITIPTLTGAVLRTDTGSIRVTDASGPVDVKTDTGSITVERCEGALLARADTGGIKVTAHTGPVEAETDTGSVKVTLTDQSDAPVSIKTDTGSASLSVGKAFNGVIKAEVDTGKVSIKGNEARITARDMGKHRGRITVGGGGEESSVVTDTGSISITVR